jgi:hypothetical protein
MVGKVQHKKCGKKIMEKKMYGRKNAAGKVQ